MATSPFLVHKEKLEKDFIPRQHQHYIDGKYVAGESDERIIVNNPATGKQLGTVAAGTAADVDRAVQSAHKAFVSGVWQYMPAIERTKILNRYADLIEQNADELSTLETLNDGNPILHVRHGDIAMAINYLRYYAGYTDKIGGVVPSSNSTPNTISYQIRQPIGVAAAITPWNAPVILGMFKIGPALAAGCSLVLKPAELAPLTSLRLAELASEAGVPDGVFNVVTGYGPTAGAALAEHPLVNKIGFTGSTETGQSIVRASAGNLKRVTLELGGKSPVVIFADADIDAAIAGISEGIFYKTGQFCAAGTRIFIEDKVYDKVVAGFEARAKAAKVGDPMKLDTQLGPIISRKQLDRVLGYLDAGRSAGAEVVTGGNQLSGGDYGEGFYVEPTLFANVNHDMSIMQEEIFGPVVCATRFSAADGIEKIAEAANNTRYGLAARLWTTNMKNGLGLARLLDAGNISINNGMLGDQSFGGFKMSGLGRELGYEGIEAYTETKAVGVTF